jgi:cytidine deaminase
MKKNIEELFASAKNVYVNAYAPYSNFNVAVALLGSNNKIYSGVNVENSSYPEGICAEAAAIGKMVTNGCKEIYEILVLADTKLPTTPCGGCRQRLMEFSNNSTPVYLCNLEKLLQVTTIGDLLPGAFNLKTIK